MGILSSFDPEVFHAEARSCPGKRERPYLPKQAGRPLATSALASSALFGCMEHQSSVRGMIWSAVQETVVIHHEGYTMCVSPELQFQCTRNTFVKELTLATSLAEHESLRIVVLQRHQGLGTRQHDFLWCSTLRFLWEPHSQFARGRVGVVRLHFGGVAAAATCSTTILRFASVIYKPRIEKT